MKFSMIHHFGGLGGGLISCLDIAKMLTELGNDVEVYIPNPDNQVRCLFETNRIVLKDNVPKIIELTYHNASSNALVAIIKSIRSLKNRIKWESFFETLESDIVIFNSLVQAPMIPLAKKNNKKCLMFVRETIRGDSNAPFNIILKRLLKKCDAVVFLTQFDRQTWHLTNKTPQYVIPDIVNSEYFNAGNAINMEKKDGNSGTSFLYLGGLSPIKGALDILLAFEEYIKSGHNGKLFILGGTYESLLTASVLHKLYHINEISYLKKCNEAVKRINKINEYVTVVGLTSYTEKWYEMSDVIVFPVTKVHQARPVYEAGYYGKTVILPDYNNFKEAVINGQNGLLYKKGDVHDLCKKMILMENDKVACKAMAFKNKELYEKKHSYLVGLKELERMINIL